MVMKSVSRQLAAAAAQRRLQNVGVGNVCTLGVLHVLGRQRKPSAAPVVEQRREKRGAREMRHA